MQKYLKSTLLASCLGLSLALTACSPTSNGAGTVASTEETLPKMTDAASYGKAAAEWQLSKINNLAAYIPSRIPQSTYNRGWVKGTFYIGLERFALKTNNKDYLQRLVNESFENGFELGERYWHGDDQIMGSIYSGVIERGDADLEILRPTLEKMDLIIEDRSTVSLEFRVPKPGEEGAEGTCQTRWCWADAIFMAPPAWAAVSNVTGDDKYRQYAVEEADATIEYLFDEDTNLFFRDSRYFTLKTENGRGVFWSRGNGWVYAGLARFMETLPADHESRARYEELFIKMSDALVSRQREDGYWPTSLDDPALFKNPETSGTAFFGFGLAWGINQGILKGDKYTDARDKAWVAMKDAVQPNGMVGWVQQIGKDPQLTIKDSSQLYGVGGFLLMASEMIEAGE
jgi:rhamnogalacturonyl hydrolase YesR